MKSKIVFLTLGMALLTSCGEKRGMPEASIDYAVKTLTAGDVSLNTSYPASIKGEQDIEIRPKVAGHITRLLVDEGANVRRGQALFQIDATQYAAAAKSAEAQVNVMKANVATQELTVENKKMLREKGIISQYDFDMAVNSLESMKAQLAAAEAQLVNAKDQLSFCTVTSPADGVVGEIPYRVGSLVSGSTPQPLTTVSNISKMFVYFSMTEKQLLAFTREKGGVKEAMEKMPELTLKLADGSDYALKGHVTAISGVIEQAVGAVQIRATFDNPNRILRSGGSGVIEIPTTAKDAVLVPQKATFNIQEKKFVYVVKEDNTVEPREIKVLVQNDGVSYVVADGVKAGERIVVQGVNQLKGGMKINPISEQQAAANQEKARQALKDGKMPGEN